MKNLLLIIALCVVAFNCNTPKKATSSVSDSEISSKKEISLVDNDTVRIANDSLEYEIIIIEPGFNYWLNSTARPRGYYSLEFLKTRNQILVTNYNIRARQPVQFDPNLYPLQIDYIPHVDYGYEVNYLLYNYFVFFQLQFNQRLGPFIPRV